MSEAKDSGSAPITYRDSGVDIEAGNALVGAIKGLVRESDHIIIDQLAHNCLHEGARAATPNIHLHRHLDVDHAERLLKRVRDFARSMGVLAKTDRLDAQVLAKFAQAVRPQVYALPDEAQATLYKLLRERLKDTTLVSIGHRAHLEQFHDRRVAWRTDAGAATLEGA